MENKLRVRGPVGPIALTVSAVLVAIVVGAVTGSTLAYAVIFAVGMGIGLILAVRSGLAANRQLKAASEPGRPRPLMVWEWPHWAKTVFRGYLTVLVGMTAIGALVVVVWAAIKRRIEISGARSPG